MAKYAIGLDYGTNSVRALVVNVANGREMASSVWAYKHGSAGILLSDDPNLARQHPADYIKGTETVLVRALESAKKALKGFDPHDVIGIGVDTTGSTPLPVDGDGKPLALNSAFSKDLAAMAWLWKDHTSVTEAEEITAYAKRNRPRFLDKCGGTYSSEWFFSKVLNCARTAPKVYEAAYAWVECCDWIPAMLTGTEHPDKLTVGICAAGHKAMYNDEWGGYPDVRFLAGLDKRLEGLASRLKEKAYSIDRSVGGLTPEWAKKTGLKAGTPVAVGAFDAHLGAVGAGIKPGTLVKIIGTSTCDIMVHPSNKPLRDIPGLCGIVPGSVLPDCIGLEAGQSAVGDIFNWFVEVIAPKGGTHEALTKETARLAPGQSGLLALDWNNGNRTVLCDQRLTGLILGQTLHTRPAEIYRALIESTAFGALTIIARLEDNGVKVDEVIACGGIAEKNETVMQIYADVTGRPMKISRSSQTCALGAAIAGAVAAGAAGGGHATFTEAQAAMTGIKAKVFMPDAQANGVYRKLYRMYKTLHDAMGTTSWNGNLHNIMKDLLAIRSETRGQV
ncbi:MAG: ribulokinase [Planctomycetaceae bacterium]|nr:ribulokinase [Planctomycetaceae bacterium]